MRVKELDVLISNNAEKTFIQEYHECKHQLEEIYNYIKQGIILRFNVYWEKNLLNVFLILKREIRQNLI